MADINVISSFKVNNAAPADAKYIVATTGDIDTLISSGNAYVGMQCYCTGDNCLYCVVSTDTKATTKYKAIIKNCKATIAEYADSVIWANVSNKPSLLADMGFTDAYTKGAIDTLLGQKVDKGDVYTKDEVDAKQTSAFNYQGTVANVGSLPENGKAGDVYTTADDGKTYSWNGSEWVDMGAIFNLTSKADKATTLAGYGITDAYTKDDVYTKAEVNAKVTALYTYKGSVQTQDDLPTTANTGDVYNVIDEKGANYAWTGSQWDSLGMTIDLSVLQSKLTTDQLAAVNSGINTTKVAAYDAYDASIVTNKNAIDKLNGTVATDGSVAKSIKTAVDNLDAEIESDDDALVKVKVYESDGKITDVVVTDQDTTLRSDITTLQGLHAKVGGTGADKDNYKTVAKEAEEAATAAVATLTENAPETLDTFKELADWIQGEGSTAFKAESRIKSLESSVGTAKTETTNGTGLTGRVEVLESNLGTTDVPTQIANKINTLDTTESANVESDGTVTKANKVGVKVVEKDGLIDSVTVVTNDIASAEVLGTASDASTANTAFGKAAKAQAKAEAVEITSVSFTNSDTNITGSFANNTLTLANVAGATDLANAEGEIDNLQAVTGLSKLDTTGANAKSLVSRIATNESDIATLNGTGTGSVSKAVSDEASRIDAIIGSGYSSTATVASGIATAKAAGDDAKINTVSFASGSALAGSFSSNTLSLTDVAQASVLASEATNIDNLQALIGESALSTNEKTIVTRLNTLEGSSDGSVAKALADAKSYADGLDTTMDGRVDALEALHAKTTQGAFKSVATEITEAINALDTVTGGVKSDATVAGTAATESANAIASTQHVQVTVKQTDGIVSSVAVSEADIASKVVLDEEIARAKKAESDEATARANAIAALDKDLTGSNAVASTSGHVTIGIKEEDGVITTLTVADNDIASASDLSTLTTYVGTAKNGTTAASGLTAKIEALESAVGEGGSVDSQIDTKINALDAVKFDGVKATTEGETTTYAIADNAKVGVKVEEVNGKVDSVTVYTNDIASADALGKLQTVVGATELAEGAKNLVTRIKANEDAIGVKAVAEVKDEEGNVTTPAVEATGLFKYVDDSTANAVTKIVSGADTSYDTLKEIADWIKNDTTGAANMANNITTLMGDENTTGSVAKAEADAKSYTDTEIGKLDATVFDGQASADATTVEDNSHVAIKVVETDGKLTSVTLMEQDIASANSLSELTTYVGVASKAESSESAGDGVTASGLTAKIEALESAVGEGGSVRTQIDAKINALDATVAQEASDTNPIAISITQTDGKLVSVSASMTEASEDEIKALFSTEEEK